ncbi:MutS-related protein [Mucilaginibacter sp.]
MNFDTDRQTLDDLGIFPNANNHKSIFALFDNTRTIGGKDKLSEIFNKPLTDINTIKNRIETIRYFLNSDALLLVDKQSCDFAEFYLKKHYHIRPFPQIIGFFEKMIYTFNSNNDYYVIQQGIGNTLNILSALLNFFEADAQKYPRLLQNFRAIVLETFTSEDFIFIKGLINKPKISSIELARADRILRHAATDQIEVLLDIVYQLDLYASVSLTAKQRGFTLPVIKDSGQSTLGFEGLFHPFINNPVVNDVDFDANHNLCFVTGTNMAGKSTFLKAVGISIYLSQLGFPVPASYMETSVFEGLITTINIDDNIDNGHSHFYSEVLRVKHVAKKISESKNVFVIFDELFRGTNVKDAYDASLAIISAFSKVRRCFFMVSTHIVEVANDLQSIDNINFRYMETVFDDGNPIYSYTLKEGITEERLGMWIVKNEGIVEIIEGAVK